MEIEETGEQFYKEIIMLDVDLVDPANTLPDIGDYIPNIVYINRDTANKARGGGGGGGHGQTNSEAEESDTFAMFEKTNDMIGMVVGTRNGGYYVKAGEIVLAINQDGGTNIKLKADTIDLEGLVTALELYAGVVTINDLIVEDAFEVLYGADCTFHCNVWFQQNVNISDLSVNNTDATWKSQSVVTAVDMTSWFYFEDTGGTIRYGRLCTGTSSTTIHYLGY